ncbi:BspA family leucine-rich repeat surface protein [Helicobacter hepaticus]|jgi:surface protein|uniref:Membrane-associated lipoprotein precurser n=1 Tax=Helicobacter hepaticus (strain ATCC 51449 / 3B1) TaxID=235279 RepID=Q7VHV6_HELHP|nr:BspA family leucine-rich repeat surface protein [Helicobacter hepaticus]AAP77454.1 hypothetical protein HH_0857 [Helicobacter hepaticus ATCC 51449]
MENKKESKELTPQEKRNKELYDVLSSCLDAPKEELESLKAKALALIEKGAVIDKEKISELEAYVSDLEQEYWDDRAVYAGRSVKDSEEYKLLQVLKKFHKAKDKAKAFDSLFMPVTKSKGVTHQPQNKAELKKLVKDKKIYLGDIDVTCVKDFTNLFENSRRKDFSGIETWDVSHVTTTRRCFCGAKHFNENIESWNVSKVKNMCQMFMDAENFNQPLNKWNTSSVTNMSEMFAYATSFNQPLDKWNVSNVDNIEYMFYGAKSFNQNLNTWKLPKVNWNHYRLYQVGKIFLDSALDENPPKWFVAAMDSKKCNGKYQPKIDRDIWYLLKDKKVAFSDIDVSLMTSMFQLFDDTYVPSVAASIKDFSGIETWDVSNVTDMSGMFRNAKNFNIDISGWNVSNVKSMSMMFYGAENFNQNLDKWQVRSDCNVKYMFEGTPLEENPPKWYKKIADKN